MATPQFYRDVNAEKERIKTRYDEIDQNISALENERRAIQDREKLLDAVGELYLSSQKLIEDAQNAQLRFSTKLDQVSEVELSDADRIGIELKTAELLDS
ncbi:MAG: hypothetical protein AB3N20_14090 [Rhizobiaceae bacterium]